MLGVPLGGGILHVARRIQGMNVNITDRYKRKKKGYVNALYVHTGKVKETVIL
jgi:hypothetical protein